MSLTLKEHSQIIMMIKEEHLDIEIIESSNLSYALVLKLNDFESLNRVTVKISELNRLKNPADHILSYEAPGIPSPRRGQGRGPTIDTDIILILDFEYSDSKEIALASINEHRWAKYHHSTPMTGSWRRKSDTPSSSLTSNNFFIDPSKELTLEENEEPAINISDSNVATGQPFRDKSF